MNDYSDTVMVSVVIVSFFVGYKGVSFLISRWTRQSTNTFRGNDSTFEGSNARAAGDTAKYWEERYAQEGRPFQEDAWRNQAPGAASMVKDEAYYGGILGLDHPFTFDDVRRQYTLLATQYHPDKVNHLGPKLRDLAESEMRKLNEAFDYFKSKYG